MWVNAVIFCDQCLLPTKTLPCVLKHLKQTFSSYFSLTCESFVEILSICTRLFGVFVAFGGHTTILDGGIFHTFSVAIRGETNVRIRKSWGCKSGTDLIYHHDKFCGDRMRHTLAIDEKVWCFCFLFVCHAFRIKKFFKKGNTIKQCNIQNN